MRMERPPATPHMSRKMPTLVRVRVRARVGARVRVRIRVKVG